MGSENRVHGRPVDNGEDPGRRIRNVGGPIPAVIRPIVTRRDTFNAGNAAPIDPFVTVRTSFWPSVPPLLRARTRILSSFEAFAVIDAQKSREPSARRSIMRAGLTAQNTRTEAETLSAVDNDGLRVISGWAFKKCQGVESILRDEIVGRMYEMKLNGTNADGSSK